MGTNNTKQAFWVALGNFFTFSFGIVSAMVLSRYFDKTEYGTYKQVFYIYNILLGVFTLGLPNAYSYFLARSPIDQTKDLIWKMTRLFMALGLCMSIVLLLGAGLISDTMKNPDLKEMLVVFAPVPFLLLPTLGLQNILVTFRRSNIIPFYVIITSVVQFTCVVLPVIIWHLGCKEALIGFNIGALISFGFAMYLNTFPVRHEADNKTQDTYRAIFKFAFPLFVASIWGTLINSTDQFFISRYFGTEVFADFSNGATDLPFVGMVIGATSAVLTPLFSRAVKDGSDYKSTILPVWDSAFAKSAMLIYPITIFCIFDAKEIMTFLYGESYISSGEYFRIKLFSYFVKIIAYYSLIVAIGATKFYQRVFMCFFICLVVAEYISIKLFANPFFITGIHVFFTILSCLAFIWYIAHRFQVHLSDMFPAKTIFKIILLSMITCALVYFLRKTLYDNLSTVISLTIDTSIFAIVFLSLSYLAKINYISIIRPLFKRA